SAVGRARCAASTCSTLVTPATCAAAFAASPASWPATSTCVSPPSLAAAAMAWSVALFSALLSCSASMRFGMASGQDLGFVAQLVDELGDVGHLAATLALRRFDHAKRGEARRDVHDADRGPG